MVGTATYRVPDRGVTLGLSGVNPARRHVVGQHSRFESGPPPRYERGINVPLKLCKICGKEKDMFSWETECSLCKKNKEKELLVREIKSGELIETEYEDEIFCPWCGWEFFIDGDNCDLFIDGEHELVCPECDKKFIVDTFVTHAFSTKRMAEMKSEWRVTSNIINGKPLYGVYRMLDTREVDCSGNREYYGDYIEDKIAARILADCLNKTEARK